MNVTRLKVGEQVMMSDGSLGEVLVVVEDGSGVRLKYLDTMGEPEKVGTEQIIPAEEVISIVQGTHTEGAA